MAALPRFAGGSGAGIVVAMMIGRRSNSAAIAMRRPSRRLFCMALAGILAEEILAAGAVTRAGAAGARPFSDDELKKIKRWIVAGRDVPLNKIVTDILGLTKEDETISARAFAVKDPENPAAIHEIGLLPAGKGYIETHIHQDRIAVYWADNDFALISAAAGARGQEAEQASFREAQIGLNEEWTFWAKFADKN
jgi:hypothetical protein